MINLRFVEFTGALTWLIRTVKTAEALTLLRRCTDPVIDDSQSGRR